MRMHNYILTAKRIGLKSNHPQHKIGAVVLKGGAIVSTAYNLHAWNRHAEIRALKHGISGDTIVVARVSGGCSKPCPRCAAAIRRAGVKQIVYVDLQGEIQRERVVA